MSTCTTSMLLVLCDKNLDLLLSIVQFSVSTVVSMVHDLLDMQACDCFSQKGMFAKQDTRCLPLTDLKEVQAC